MTDAKEPESVRALRVIRETFADVDAWVAWDDDGQLLEAHPGELLDHINTLTQECADRAACEASLTEWNEQLTRERDEAIQSAKHSAGWANSRAVLNRIATLTCEREDAREERETVSSQLWDCMNEREGLRAKLDEARVVTDAMVERAARVILSRHVIGTGKNPEKAWLWYGDDFKNEAREYLTAALSEATPEDLEKEDAEWDATFARHADKLDRLVEEARNGPKWPMPCAAPSVAAEQKVIAAATLRAYKDAERAVKELCDECGDYRCTCLSILTPEMAAVIAAAKAWTQNPNTLLVRYDLHEAVAALRALEEDV
jgi:hypothetical protein